MAESSSALTQQIARARRRLFLGLLLAALAWAWAVALVLAVGWFVAQPYVWAGAPPWARWAVLGGLLGIATLTALVLALRRAPSPVDVALSLDERFGLKERVTTSLMLAPEQAASSAGQALLADASARLAPLRVADRFPVRVPWRPAALVPVGVLALVLLALLWQPAGPPSEVRAQDDLKLSAESKAELAKKFQQIAKRQAQKPTDRPPTNKVRRIQGEVEEVVGAPRDTKDDLRESLKKATKVDDDIRKEIKAEADRIDAFKEQVKQIERLRKKQAQKDGPAKDLVKAFNEGDFKAAQDAAERLSRQLEKEEEKDRLRKKLKKDDDRKAAEEKLNKLEEEKKKEEDNVDRLKKKLKNKDEKLNDEQRKQTEDELERLNRDKEKREEEQDRLKKKLKNKDEKLNDEQRKQAEDELNKLDREKEALSEKDKEELKKQLDDLQDNAERLSRKKEEQEKELKEKQDEIEEKEEKGEMSKEEAQKEREELQREQDQLKKNGDKLEDDKKALKEAADALKESKELMKEGKDGEAAKKLAEAGKKLGQMDRTDEQRQLQQEAARVRELRRALARAASNQGGIGAGRRPEGKDGPTGAEDKWAGGELDKGKLNVVGTGGFDGGFKLEGPRKHGEMKGEIQKAAQEAPAALDRQRLPPSARAMTRGFYDAFREEAGKK